MSKLVLAQPAAISGVRKLIVRGGNFIAKQSPIILAGTAIVGVVTTTVLATKASIKANDILKAEEGEKEEPLTLQEKVEATWKVYAPTVISAGMTIGAIIASSAISQKRQAALAGLYAISENALREYQDKVDKELGPKGAQKMHDSINADRVANTPVPTNMQDIPSGKVLCFDKLTGRYFMSSAEALYKAANDLNHAILTGDMCASLNELYSNFGLDECDLGEDIGWNLECLCELCFTSCLTSDAKPCLVVDYASGHGPDYRYRDI